MPEVVATLKRSLTDAGAALADGDVADAERRAKAITALVRAERDVAELATANSPSTDEDEEFCADLRRRLVEYAQADLADAPAEVLERIATQGLRR